MSKSTRTVKELIELLYDGHEAYERAARKVSSPALHERFERLGSAKQAIANALTSYVHAHGEAAPAHGTVRGRLERIFANVRAAVSGIPDRVYAKQLEKTEERILTKFREELGDTTPAIRTLVSRFLTDLQRSRDEMERVKEQLTT
jgi:uncharacterized protein (TIGR02284 family)